MDNTGGAITNERMRVLLLGKHTGSTRFEHSVLPGRLGGAAASSGQSRSGGGSPGTEQGGFGDGAAFSPLIRANLDRASPHGCTGCSTPQQYGLATQAV